MVSAGTEASAFAEYAGKQLPTIYHWANAANVVFSAAVVPLSNLGNRSPGPGPVGKFAGLTGFGALDMAGNAREWVANEAGSKRYLLGGAWDDGPDMFTGDFALPPFDRRAAKRIPAGEVSRRPPTLRSPAGRSRSRTATSARCGRCRTPSSMFTGACTRTINAL